MQIHLISQNDPDWVAATGLISRVFLQTYGAKVRTFPSELMISKNTKGDVTAAVGLRTKCTGFFSTIYLPGDLAQTISQVFEEPVSSEHIIEAVSLAAENPAVALPLMNAVISEGRRRNMRWGLFTGTRGLRVLLTRAGLPFRKVCPASIGDVRHPEDWGSYYASDPWVCAFTESREAPLALAPKKPLKILKGAS